MSQDEEMDLIAAVPGLVRLAAGSWLRTASWSVGAYARAGERLARAAVSPEAAGDLVQDVRDVARSWLGIDQATEGEERKANERGAQQASGSSSLRERGAELLRLSADVRYEEDVHPAYSRILGELAPDEARILRFLASEGPQPSVDVRSSKTLNVSSQLVAPGLSMIAAGAGARYLERVPAYLNNLYRLGLVWFSREPLPDPLDYQVLEAQPDVLGALRSGAGRGRTVRRSIHLTPFGEDFCHQCLPVSLRSAGSGQISAGPPFGGRIETTKELENG
ncbi:MAG: DUF4393 domain-containing protein [Solirubrobacteraceae bacterium]